MLGHCAKAQQPMIATAIRQVFQAQSGEEARARLAEVVDRLERPAPKVARLLLEAEPDVLAFYAFPEGALVASCASTNPLERVNREIGRRTDVVGIFLRVLLLLARTDSTRAPEQWVTRNLSVEPIRL